MVSDELRTKVFFTVTVAFQILTLADRVLCKLRSQIDVGERRVHVGGRQAGEVHAQCRAMTYVALLPCGFQL